VGEFQNDNVMQPALAAHPDSCGVVAEAFRADLAPVPGAVGKLKIPQFTRVDHPDGSATVTDDVGLRMEILPGVSTRAQNAATFYESVMPESMRKTLAAGNVPLYVANHISDVNLDLKGKALPVEDPRKTWDNVGGAYFDNKTWNMLGEKAMFVDPDHLDGMTHEGAHGLDDLLGRPSQTAEFRAMYDADLKHARDNDIGLNPYLTQPGERGVQETFAEVYDALAAKTLNPMQAQVLKMFPRIACYIRENFHI